MLIVGADGIHAADGTLLAAERGLLWAARHPSLPLLYGVSESVVTWRLGERVVRVGSVPVRGVEGCHLAVTAEALHVAAYGSGTVHRYTLVDGIPAEERVLQLRGGGPDRERQDAAHPHHVLPQGDTVVVTDLGSDSLVVLDAVTLAERDRIALPPGCGPRHTLRLDARTLAITGELDASVLLVRDGSVVARQSVSGGAGPVRAYPSDLVEHSGDLVVAVRGSGILARFDPATLAPRGTLASGGRWPQALAVERGALHCADRDGDRVTVVDGLRRRLTRIIPRPTALISEGTP